MNSVCESDTKEVEGVVDALVYYDWEPSDANLTDAYFESGFEESCESRGFETISGAVLMGRGGFTNPPTAALPTLPESYIGEQSGMDYTGLFWNGVYGMAQIEGRAEDNMFYPNQTQVSDLPIRFYKGMSNFSACDDI